MAQSTLVMDSGFIMDLHAVGGIDALEQLTQQYNNIVIPQIAIERLSNDPTLQETLTTWQAANENNVDILPALDDAALEEMYPGYLQSPEFFRTQPIDQEAWAVRHATDVMADNDIETVVATSQWNTSQTILETTEAQTINGVSSYLDTRIASGEMSLDAYMDAREILSTTQRQHGESDPTPGISDRLAADLRARDAGPREIEMMMHAETRGFFADADNLQQFYLNTELMAVTEVTPDGMTTREFESGSEAAEYFGAQRLATYEANPEAFDGSLPLTVSGNLVKVADFHQSVVDPTLRQALGRGAAEGGEFLGRASKILGPVGTAFTLHEVSGLHDTMEELVEEGLMTQDAADAYALVYETHVLQSLADRSVVGGELLVQEYFDTVGEAHNVHPAVREMLEPGSLLEDLGHAAAYVTGQEVETEAQAYDRLNGSGTPFEEALEIVANYETEINDTHVDGEPYPPQYERLNSPEIHDTFERLQYENQPRLPVELTDEMTQEAQVDAILDAGQAVYRENGYTRLGPPREAVAADIEPVVAPQASPLPQRADVAEDYDHGAY